MTNGKADLLVLRLRMAGIGTRLDGNWSKALEAQRHLDRDTDECAYWHSGYHQALADVIAMMSNVPEANDDISDTSNLFRVAG